jgi:ABC-type transport system substrate-binding protein
MYLSSRAVDRLTAEVTLKIPSLAFLPIMCSAQFRVLPKKAINQRLGKPGKYEGIFNLTDNPPMGTGPFKFEESRGQDFARMTRNDNYWRKDPHGKALPYLDGYQSSYMADENTRIGAFRTGRLHFMATFPITSQRTANEMVKALGQDKVYIVRGNAGLTDGMNVLGAHHLNRQREFRWALALVTNVWEFQERVFEGQIETGVVVSREIYPDVALPKEELLKSLQYNPDRTEAHQEARRLLAKIGIDIPNHEVRVTCSAGGAKACEMMELYAKQLRDFGFKTRIEAQVPGAPAATDESKARWAMTTGPNTRSVLDPSVVLNNRYLLWEADWMDANGQRAASAVRLRELTERSIGTADPAEKLKALQDGQRLVANEDTISVLIGWWRWSIPVHSSVHGLFRWASMSEGQQNRYTWLAR